MWLARGQSKLHTFFFSDHLLFFRPDLILFATHLRYINIIRIYCSKINIFILATVSVEKKSEKKKSSFNFIHPNLLHSVPVCIL